MAVRKTITVSITPEQDTFVRDRLQSGRFSSISEVVRAGLRLLEREEVSGHRSPGHRSSAVPEIAETTSHPGDE